MDYFEIARQFFVGGMHLLQENNLEGAEAQFARSLEIMPDRVSTLNNLAGVKIKLQKFAEAETFARKAIKIEEKSPEAWANLGIVLARTGRAEEALPAYDRALQANGAFVSAWVAKAEALLELKRYEEALTVCDRALTLGPNQHEVLYAQSLALKGLGQREDAREAYTKSLALRVAKSPVSIARRRETQKADILILSPDPCLDDELKSFEALHQECPNYPGQLARLLKDDFHLSFVFKGDAISPTTRAQIPQPDFVINNCANAEAILADGSVAGLIEAADSLGVPVVNHPTKVVQTGRDGTAKLLANLPGVRVPKTMRFSSVGKTFGQLVQEIEAEFEYPLITRPLSAQRGIGMNRADSRDELVEGFASEMPQEFFVTQFVDSRAGEGLFRKLRASIVRDELVIVRVDFHPTWKVHGGRSGRRVSFYLENPHLLEQEKRICADPEKELGSSAVQSLRAIRERIPLDVFGIDFNVDAEGVVHFYEANATMNLLSTAQAEVANPQESNDRLKQAFRRYLAALANLK
jgi:tetratricopeptide (TPR) repeat protein